MAQGLKNFKKVDFGPLFDQNGPTTPICDQFGCFFEKLRHFFHFFNVCVSARFDMQIIPFTKSVMNLSDQLVAQKEGYWF